MSPERTRAYDAEILQCHACAAADIAQRMYLDSKGDPAGLRRRIFERQPVRPTPATD